MYCKVVRLSSTTPDDRINFDRITATAVALLASSQTQAPLSGCGPTSPPRIPGPPRALIKSHANVTTHASGKVDLGLEVELDTDQQGGRLLLALLVDGTLQKLACEEVLASLFPRRADKT